MGKNGRHQQTDGQGDSRSEICFQDVLQQERKNNNLYFYFVPVIWAAMPNISLEVLHI